ncbi:hypothetical protein P43SY_000705 [Pythium insidiosum]|uniref:Uncharacterized protein n=1 Tax=Pythium insidiosum TaxID=114742 RepID=A0AAD5LT99_PYTIN|nr:hypothetical protein P43SY_000705 [Pythium insidiosum]
MPPSSSWLQGPAWTYLVQFVFLFTGVFSTCAAQFVFYEGAGDQKAMLLPLCNYLGMMLVGLIPVSRPSAAPQAAAKESAAAGRPASPPDGDGPVDEPERTEMANDDWERRHLALHDDAMELTRRPAGGDVESSSDEQESALAEATAMELKVTPSTVIFSASAVQLCIAVSVVLDFAGCIFSNMGLAMAGSGLFQVVYSSVICWSALLSRFVLKKNVSKEEWTGIALVTFGLAFSALGESGGGRNSYVVLMGCFNTLVGAAFYGGNYVTGEYTLKLPERPQPKELCLKIGTACVGIIAIYQLFFVLPVWQELVTKPIEEARGSTTRILVALAGYTLSQLAHGLTYFMLLGSSGAVTTGIMQSLRAVCVFAISSVLYCSRQESQCFDTKRGVATLIVISGVMYYSWAKSQVAKGAVVGGPSLAKRRRKSKLVAGKNYVV